MFSIRMSYHVYITVLLGLVIGFVNIDEPIDDYWHVICPYHMVEVEYVIYQIIIHWYIIDTLIHVDRYYYWLDITLHFVLYMWCMDTDRGYREN